MPYHDVEIESWATEYVSREHRRMATEPGARRRNRAEVKSAVRMRFPSLAWIRLMLWVWWILRRL